jgi:hypothetical protein
MSAEYMGRLTAFQVRSGLSIGCPHDKFRKRKRSAAEEMIQPDEPLGTVGRKTALAQAWLSGSMCNAPIVDASGPRVVMRVTGHPPENAFIVTGIWKPAFHVLERMTAGRIRVRDCWGAVVHGDREGAAALRAGLTDMALCYSPWDPASFPLARVLGLPGLFPTAEVATHVAEAIYWDYLRADVERQGLRMGRLKATGALQPVQQGADSPARGYGGLSDRVQRGTRNGGVRSTWSETDAGQLSRDASGLRLWCS